jgi:hypothetical protein
VESLSSLRVSAYGVHPDPVGAPLRYPFPFFDFQLSTFNRQQSASAQKGGSTKPNLAKDAKMN